MAHTTMAESEITKLTTLMGTIGLPKWNTAVALLITSSMDKERRLEIITSTKDSMKMGIDLKDCYNGLKMANLLSILGSLIRMASSTGKVHYALIEGKLWQSGLGTYTGDF